MSETTRTGEHHALVVGATGIIGSAIMQRLSVADGWTTIGLSRSRRVAEGRARMLDVDLLDAQDCSSKLGALDHITHIFYAAYQARPSRAEEVAPNVRMLRNVIDAVSARARNLQKVVLVTGAKFYGIQWGRVKTPMKETDSRQLPPNFYYDQEDFLRDAQQRSNWHWCNLIPPFVSGYSVGNPMNLVMAIGVFASLSKALNVPLRFPGLPGAWSALQQLADADQIAAAAHWAALSPAANNEAFNVTNGDPIRWENVWPAVAAHFGLELQAPKTLPLGRLMADNEAAWAHVVERHQLNPTPLTKLVDWNWADYMFRMDYDVLMETGKIRRAGFHDCVDTTERFLTRFRQLQEHRIIPR
jgi:nucleoside-diphosphate-sugar epimerase